MRQKINDLVIDPIIERLAGNPSSLKNYSEKRLPESRPVRHAIFRTMVQKRPEKTFLARTEAAAKLTGWSKQTVRNACRGYAIGKLEKKQRAAYHKRFKAEKKDDSLLLFAWNLQRKLSEKNTDSLPEQVQKTFLIILLEKAMTKAGSERKLLANMLNDTTNMLNEISPRHSELKRKFTEKFIEKELLKIAQCFIERFEND